MFSWLTDSDVLLGGLVLAAVQVAAALPWLRAVDRRGFARAAGDPSAWVGLAAVWLAAVAALGYKADSAGLPLFGRIYGAVLHLQVLADLALVGPVAVAAVWPKGGAVALAAYRESCRQPLFWLVTLGALVLTWVWVVLPYFTFGDDFKMMKHIGFDTIMAAAGLFGVLAAAISISEEIEGRTAITLLSKPVNRRQFLLGKFAGILMACGLMAGLLAWNLNWGLLAQPEFDPINKDRAFDPMPAEAKAAVVPVVQAAVGVGGPARAVADGAGQWFGESLAHLLGVGLLFGQVAVLVAVASALATRLPFVLNLVGCVGVYFLGHLAPVVVKESARAAADDPGSSAVKLVEFLGRLFDAVMPALEPFSMGPAIVRDTPLSLAQFAGWVAAVGGYAVIYTAIALIVGLLLFEDRDLA